MASNHALQYALEYALQYALEYALGYALGFALQYTLQYGALKGRPGCVQCKENRRGVEAAASVNRQIT